MSSVSKYIQDTEVNKAMEAGQHHLLLSWLVFTGVLLFALYVGWQENILSQLYETDRSHISIAITLIYILVTGHCAMRIGKLSYESNQVHNISHYIYENPDVRLDVEDNRARLSGYGYVPNSLMGRYLHDLVLQHQHRTSINNEDNNASRDLIEVYAAKLKGPQEIGWFATDIMLKLGLLGTIVGFIMMLGSVANISDFDVTTMQKILQLMSSGMGTALYTTMAGLSASMLAAAQYYMLDRSSDQMLEAMQHISEVRLKPALSQA
ncbi:hypothetical protein J2T55_000542 [Methylohalomonas lacus]|uniref:MotA/TolQ/ExbB proton channel domain-containing protein n=1 Tax=Methylohalomonas lacus TaxID=398773 RepID=A0AAE3HJS3_9GAMM|nr:MotA/TolQ/ExbB proton channel family protein [Methylohalomonas lacus]MCS3902538.1 hypothetical protein [Methylohalomonas lacus]